MKKAPFYVVLLLAVPVYGATQPEPDNTPPAVTVYTQFQHPYSAASVDAMKQELDAIMAPLGLDFAWRSLDGVRGNEVSLELVVVTFKGACEIDDEIPGGGESGALGWTHMSDGSILPFSDIDCDKIRRFISGEVRSIEPEQRDRVYGRAIGRVLAHELYHVFTNTTRHASWGVAKGFYTSRELVSDRFEFQEKDTKSLRGGRLKSVRRSRKAAGFAGGGQ